MELKDGYRQTEIGIIPNDWDIKPFHQVSFMKGRIGWQGLKQTEFTFNQNEPFLITGMNFKDGEIEWEEVYHVSEERYEIAKEIQLKPNDVLMTKDGTIGKLLFVNNIPFPYKATLNSHLLVFRPIRDSYVPKYLYYQLDFKYFKNHIELAKSGTTFYGISQESVGKFQLPLPPLPEQQAIAEVLSDTDNLIQSLEKQIAKKRLIKQGAMQQLLTPKEGWEVKKLPKVCWFQEGPGLRNWQFTKSGMKVINVTNLVNGYLDLDRTDRHITMDEFNKMYKHFEIDENDIVMASSGNSYSKVSVVRKQDLPLLMNTSVIRFKPIGSLDYNYLLVFLKSKLFKDQIDLLITGGAQPNFGPAHLKLIDFPIPSSKQEQINIASIITSMDDEIELLEKKKEKYQLLKHGLMQNLLTGKIRLV